MTPRRYQSPDEDSDRWRRFPFRAGDVVVSTRSKSGTTWMQRICIALVSGSAELSGPLVELSPWVDWVGEPEAALFARLAAQPGRRVLKTHTPLDGVVLDRRATFIVVVRDPLDMAVSLYHQGDNLDRQRIAELTGRPAEVPSRRPPLTEWLARWTLADTDPITSMDSLGGVVHHAADAWMRFDGHQVLVLRYEDLCANLAAQMRIVADYLGVTVDPDAWSCLVDAASLPSMRADAHRSAPHQIGVLRDPARFFRRGTPGAGREILSGADVEAYEDRVRDLVALEDAADPAGVLRLLGLGG